MAFSARVLLDSRSPSGARLTTLEVRYPRFIHSEMMTHRVFSRNAASSRAIPIKKMIAAVREEPALPVYWGRNQTGMSAREAIAPDVEERARAEWQARARRRAASCRTAGRAGHRSAQAAGEPAARAVRLDHGDHHRDRMGEFLHPALPSRRAARDQTHRRDDARGISRQPAAPWWNWAAGICR